jgi:hypothetical protein
VKGGKLMSEFDQNTVFDVDPTTKAPIVELEIDERKAMLAQFLAMGKSTAEISVQLEVSEAWVRMHKKEPEVKSIVSALQKEALESAKHMVTYSSRKAAETLDQLLSDSNPGIKLAAANSILDRTGIRPPEKGSMVNVQVNISNEEKQQRLQSRLERMKNNE